MKKLKIGIVLDDSLDSSDGVQQYVLATGRWLTSEGNEVHYLVGETHRTDLPNLHSLARNVGVQFNGNKLSMPLPASKLRIKQLLDRENFDVLHVQVPYSPFMAHRVIKAAAGNTAVVGTFHILPNSPAVSLGSHLLSWWLKTSLKRFDKFVSVSTAAASFARHNFGIESTVLPNVIDYQRFHNAEPFSRYTDDITTILFLGRLVPRKGCRTLLEAVDVIVNERQLSGFRVLVCGKGPLGDELKRYVQEHKLQSYVEFTGFVNEADKPRYYASADISVFPSSGGESFGIVLLEAMASGRSAVLAGNNPGYASVMSAQPELLFDAKDSRLLAEKLTDLLEDDSKRQHLAAWGSNYAASFDTALVGKQLMAFYEQALHSRLNLP